ncbi:MAG TPA: DoxX family protein [Candidatus Paceibacterota bacterium]
MRKDITALVVRLIVGGIFITAGYLKVTEMAGTIGFFGQLGIPAFLAYVVTYAELIGGAFIVLGLWTCISAAVLAVVMLVAVVLSFPGGFQAYSYPLVVLAGLVSLIGSCGGKYSITGCRSCRKVSVPADAQTPQI